MEDIDILKQVLEKKINLQDLDDDTKIRIIYLCKKRVNQLNGKIEERNKTIQIMEKIIDTIKKQNRSKKWKIFFQYRI